MKLFLVLSTVAILFGGVSTADAQRQPIDGDWNNPKCIEEVWERTKPTEEEKKFDLENDLDLDGTRYSCFTLLAPSEINETLTTIKEAVKNDDKAKLADLVVYPFDYWITADNHPLFGDSEPITVMDRQDFINKYDDIINSDVKKMLNCATLSKMSSNAEGSVFLARGYLQFAKKPDNYKETGPELQKYPLRLYAIDVFNDRAENWYNTNCH